LQSMRLPRMTELWGGQKKKKNPNK
jgi:hypothetical protein